MIIVSITCISLTSTSMRRLNLYYISKGFATFYSGGISTPVTFDAAWTARNFPTQRPSNFSFTIFTVSFGEGSGSDNSPPTYVSNRLRNSRKLCGQWKLKIWLR